MKKITLDEIRQNKKITEYQELYNYVTSQVQEGKLKAVNSSGNNGMKPALYCSYWIIEEKKDYSVLVDELRFKIRPEISTDYYLSHIDVYEKDREYVLLLNDYLSHKDKLAVAMSKNERSFDIWKQEKFLSEGQGKRICAKCGIELEQLAFYDTFEPLAYHSGTRVCPQNILIIENKDTFFTMRRLMQQGENVFCGEQIGTLIYGAGKGIVKAFQGIALSGEEYMLQADNRFLYFGDLDYEGIGIYESLAESVRGERKIIPFVNAYKKMLEKNQTKPELLPHTKDGQNRNIGMEFLSYFEPATKNYILNILEKDRYLPQECLNEADLEDKIDAI